MSCNWVSLNFSSAPEDILHLPQNFTVEANDRVWRRITGLGFDQGLNPVYSGDVFNWGIAFPALGLRSEFYYLQFLYPRALTMADMLLHTSNALKALNRAELLEGEYWRWLGIRLVTNDSTARITRSAALDVNNLVVPPVSINPVVVLYVYDIVCALWSFIFSECCWWTC